MRETFGRRSIDGIATLAGLIEGKRGARGEKIKLEAYRWLADQSIGKAVQALSGPDGEPINLLDFSKLTTEQLEQVEKIRAALMGKP